MINSQAMKAVNIMPPGVIKDTASHVSIAFDTAGFDYCTILVSLGATDIAMSALKVQESDALDAEDATALDGNKADVTGLVYGAANQTALPSATQDNGIFAFDIDLKKRKRYLAVVSTAGNGEAGTYASAVALLSRAEQSPTTVAERGLLGVQRV